MKKHGFYCFVLTGIILLLLFGTISAEKDTNLQEKAARIHQEAVVIDAHNDTLMHLVDGSWRNRQDERIAWQPVKHLNEDLSQASEFGHVNLDLLKAGGLNAPVFAAFASEAYYPGRSLDRSLALLNAMDYNLEKNHEYMELAFSAEDVENIVLEKDKKAALLSIEGADFITQARGLELLKQYRDLGVRIIGPAWNTSNELAEGLYSQYPDGEPSEPGLSEFGREFVKKSNDLGIVVDVSHLHKNSFYDVLDTSNKPVIASHSSVRSLVDHTRNLTDEQIQALAEQGGVICIAFVPQFIAENPDAASVGKIVDHVDHVVDLVGVEHVGLGSDFDGARMPPDVPHAGEYKAVTKELLQRGYDEQEIKKILGENILRVLRENEKGTNQVKELKIGHPLISVFSSWTGRAGITDSTDSTDRTDRTKRAGRTTGLVDNKNTDLAVFLELPVKSEYRSYTMERVIVEELIEAVSLKINGRELDATMIQHGARRPFFLQNSWSQEESHKNEIHLPSVEFTPGIDVLEILNRGYNLLTYKVEYKTGHSDKKTTILKNPGPAYLLENMSWLLRTNY